MTEDSDRTKTAPPSQTHEYAVVPNDSFEREQALEAIVYADRDDGGYPTLAQVAAALNWPVIATAEAVGGHYWMFLTGDLTDANKTMVEYDGE